MEHNDWENGKRLTTSNATRSQLVWMVKDCECIIDRQRAQIERLQNQLEQWQSFCCQQIAARH